MSDMFFNEETENYHKSASNGLVRKYINDLNVESKSAIIQIREMKETVAALKSKLQSVAIKGEQNIDTFKGRITRKIGLMLNLLSKKQTYIQNTLNNCYNMIDNLVENFFNVGYQLEKDITTISLKINDFDSEIKNLAGINCEKVADGATLWFVNSKGRLTKRKNIVLSSVLPQFKCGDRKMRQSFIKYIEEVFSASQVPKTLWVSLASSQLIGMAYDWWHMHDKSMSWSQFTKCFIDWTFSNKVKRKILTSTKRHSFNSFFEIPELTPPLSSESRSNFLDDSTSNILDGLSSSILDGSSSSVLAGSTSNVLAGSTSNVLAGSTSNILAGSISNILAGSNSKFSAESTTQHSTESIPKSDINISDEDSGTVSSTSSFKLCKKKTYSFVKHNTKNKEIIKVNQQSKNNGIKSQYENQKKLRKR